MNYTFTLPSYYTCNPYGYHYNEMLPVIVTSQSHSVCVYIGLGTTI